MANIHDLFYPPGIKPSEQAAKNTGTTIAYQISNQPLLISNPDENKYSWTEVRLI